MGELESPKERFTFEKGSFLYQEKLPAARLNNFLWKSEARRYVVSEDGNFYSNGHWAIHKDCMTKPLKERWNKMTWNNEHVGTVESENFKPPDGSLIPRELFPGKYLFSLRERSFGFFDFLAIFGYVKERRRKLQVYNAHYVSWLIKNLKGAQIKLGEGNIMLFCPLDSCFEMQIPSIMAILAGVNIPGLDLDGLSFPDW